MTDADKSALDIRQHLTTMFGTPFVSYDWEDVGDLNKELAELVLAEEQSDDLGRGIRSNAGGWQRNTDPPILSWV